MKKHFLPLLFLFTVIFGLISCTHQFKTKPNVSLKIPTKQLYRSILSEYDVEAAEVEIKLFVDDQEFDSQSFTITSETSSDSKTVNFIDVPLYSTVYAQASVSITQKKEKITILKGESPKEEFTEEGLSLIIELKKVDDTGKYVPDFVIGVDGFILKYNFYKYDQSVNVNDPEKYELYKTLSFTINYKDFVNFSEIYNSNDLLIQITEAIFDLFMAGYDENYDIEDEGVPEIINGIATLNSYWYKVSDPITPVVLEQKADIPQYILKLYSGASKMYVIEDANNNRLALGSWDAAMVNIEPMQIAIFLIQTIEYIDGNPVLSFDPKETDEPNTLESYIITEEGVTVKNIINDEEIEITFDTTGVDGQALLETSNPQPDEIQISIDCDNDIYSVGSTIAVTARNLTQGTNIPANEIYTEITTSLIDNGASVATYSLYPTISEELQSYFDGEQFFIVEPSGNTLLVKTALPDGFVTPQEDMYMRFDFSFTVYDALGDTTQEISKIIKDGTVSDIELSIDVPETIYGRGTDIIVTARNTKENTTIPASDITASITAQAYTYNSFMSSYEPMGTPNNIYPDLDSKISVNYPGVNFFIDKSTEDSIILQTNIPDDFLSSELTNKQVFILRFSASDSSNYSAKTITLEMLPGVKPDVTVTMSPNKKEIPKNETVRFTAADKNGPISADKISIELGQENWINNTFVWQPLEAGYNTTLNSTNNSMDLSFTSECPVDVEIIIKVTVTKDNSETEETRFTVKIAKPRTQGTVTIATSDDRNSIINKIKQVFTQNDFPNNQLELSFIGSNDSTDINLYGVIKEILSDMNISYYGYGRILSLDYSGVTGNIVATIPSPATNQDKGAFEDMDILQSIVLSSSTLSIGDYAFYSADKTIVLDELDLKEVTEIGLLAFTNTTITGEFNLPNVIQFGNRSCEGIIAEVVNLGAAEEIYSASGSDPVGLWVFKDSKIDTLVANNLKRIGSLAFNGAEIGDFAIPDSLIYIGYRSLTVTKASHIYFASANGAQNWYRLNDGGFKIGNQMVAFDDIAYGIYLDIYEINDLLALISGTEYEGQLEAIDPDYIFDNICSDDVADYVKNLEP